ncbi:DUF4167 domain-containing protein, partial [Caulobacter sp. 17J80-11]|uniref:DUF4167 domain-containing protein n=1 Tax=Caulobacter sp. 17J80-11 TaxID=2763502 RepID=UPI002107D6D1
MKRQRGRNRKPGGGGQGGGGSTNPNRAWESTGPENVKVRGNAQHVYERYHQLARDASSSGDRVLAENYLQHAEHYFRVLRTLQPQRPVSEIAARDAFASGFDIDFEDESGEPIEMDGVAEAGETEGGDQQSARDEQRHEQRYEQRRDDRRDREPREQREPREPREPREAREDRGERRFEGEARGDGSGGGRRENRRDRYERRR